LTQEPVAFSNQLHQRLSAIEKRDLELWFLTLTVVGILALGYFIVIFPTVFMGQKEFFIQAKVSPQLAIGQLVLITMFLVYIIHKHIQVRSVRSKSLVEAFNFQLAHAQLLLDPLTQVLNRAALEELISKELKRVRRKQTTLVFLYIDVNDLKKVNTRFGHLSGDLVLGETGAILKQCVRGSDYVVRMGGDEFLVALIDTDEAGAETVRQRIDQHVDFWNRASRLPGFQLELSVGIQQFDATKSLDEVLAEADAKMYREKETRASARS